MDTMLSKALREFTSGPLNQLIVNLGGQDGDRWEGELKRFLRKEPCWEKDKIVQVRESSNVLRVDRSKRFDYVAFPGMGCYSITFQDERSLAISEIDLAKIELETAFLNGEKKVGGIKRRSRLKEDGRILLDVAVACALLENQNLIPGSWKGKKVHFDGTIFTSSKFNESIFYLYWNGIEWTWCCSFLGDEYLKDTRSALLVV